MRTATLLFLAFLTGCATPTGYVKSDPAWSPNYGYRDKPMGGNEFSVSFTGNRHTGAQRAAEIVLLRAARLTREQGGTHFVILKEKARAMEAVQLTTLPVVGAGFAAFVPVREQAALEPTAILLIQVVPGQKPVPPEAVDAQSVIDRLGARYR
ncbi:CC0125/CC1285 family lipoprotein [Geomesophilobacter sediminis]|uniref:Lipoprotein n=1 Tax=Geomesophilobacter sediminis TaxID=2798584 RepID=A0A8J7M1Y9_9BACT|nr:hypothetical protein [Geomesophilobacter sediminis]MBJ6727223.1 hypothetical protein [Geomesophilobacter sediminis]